MHIFIETNIVGECSLAYKQHEYTVVSGYKPWARSAWQRDNMGSGTKNGAFASEEFLAYINSFFRTVQC